MEFFIKNERLNKLQQTLKNQQKECSLITSRHNIFYLSNFDYEPLDLFIGLFVLENREHLL
jgi:Xaa-Pro dipeptidase